MGEAKRRKTEGLALTDGLAARRAAGEFGPPTAADRYCVVLDKSPAGATALAALRAAPVLDGLDALLATDAMRLWQASSLFAYAVLCGGAGAAEARCLLAADLRRLTERALPQALQRFGGAQPPGLVLAVDAATAAALAHRAR